MDSVRGIEISLPLVPCLDISMKKPGMRAPTGCWSAFAVAVAFVAGSAAPARAQSTTLYLNSQAGDYIGGGVSQSYTTADGVFNARSSNGAQHVAISFNTPTYSHWWYLDFAAPTGLPLTAGGYDGATRYPFQSPSLRASSNGTPPTTRRTPPSRSIPPQTFRSRRPTARRR
jgi:hypothetical protein